MVDILANPAGADFLLRDCHDMCTWFRRRGLEVDSQELFGEVVARLGERSRGSGGRLTA